MKQLPVLEELEKERERKERKIRDEEREQLKKGCAEDMTVRLLKEVLDEMGINYAKTCKKADLIKAVQEARKSANNTTETSTTLDNLETVGSERPRTTTQDRDSETTSSCRPSGDHSPKDIGHPFTFSKIIYYYDNKKDKLLFLLLILIHLFFLMEIVGIFLDIVALLQLAELLIVLQVLIVSLVGLIYVYLCLLQALNLYFTSFLYACVNLAPFLHETNFSITA